MIATPSVQKIRMTAGRARKGEVRAQPTRSCAAVAGLAKGQGRSANVEERDKRLERWIASIQQA